MDGIRAAAASRSDSQAGDPLGGVFFIMVHARIDRVAREHLREHGLTFTVPYDPDVPFWLPASPAEQVEVRLPFLATLSHAG